MMIIDFLVYVMMFVYIVWDIELLGYVILGLFAVMLVVRVFRSAILSKKTFVCLECGEIFKLKWSDLYRSYSTWGTSISSEDVEKDGTEYKRLWVRCKKCGMMNVGYKE